MGNSQMAVRVSGRRTPIHFGPTGIEILEQAKGRLREYGKKNPSWNDAVLLLGGQPVRAQGRRGREIVMVGMSFPSWAAPRLQERRR